MAINTVIASSSTTRVGSLRFDGLLKENHHYSIVTTENPVEAGANITDHAFVNPREVQLDVVVGDIVSTIGQATSYNPSKRSADALRQLNILMVNRKTVSVICNLAKYTNLMLVDIMANQMPQNASTLIATLSFKEINIVNSNSGAITIDTNRDQYQPTQNSGLKQLNAQT